ncbi:MAG: hypothetical protein IJX24_04835 [Oscillospiraceae bacterium]|nr:hypothetical protein [Oscillospiraceae bacterium]
MSSLSKQIESFCSEIKKEISHWEDIKDNGCSDPFWCDGVNMDLTRNHILYYKRQLRELCEENNLPLPDEYFLPTPPKVAFTYMADLKCERAKKLKPFNNITHEKIEYNSEQLSLF